MSLTREQLQALIGNCCPVPALLASSTQEVSVSAAEFAKLLSYWKALPDAKKPRLRGLTVSRASGREKRLQLLLSTGTSDTVLFSAGIDSGFPSVREVWPYAGWWEDELRSFEGISVPERRENGGVAWRRN